MYVCIYIYIYIYYTRVYIYIYILEPRARLGSSKRQPFGIVGPFLSFRALRSLLSAAREKLRRPRRGG